MEYEQDMDAVSGDAGAVADSPLGQRCDTLFEQLLDAAPDAIVGVDRAGLVVFVHAQAIRLFGYERDELLGRPIEILVPDDMVAAHRGLREKYFAAATHRAMGSGKPALLVVWTPFSTRLQCAWKRVRIVPSLRSIVSK